MVSGTDGPLVYRHRATLSTTMSVFLALHRALALHSFIGPSHMLVRKSFAE